MKLSCSKEEYEFVFNYFNSNITNLDSLDMRSDDCDGNNEFWFVEFSDFFKDEFTVHQVSTEFIRFYVYQNLLNLKVVNVALGIIDNKINR